MPLPLMSARLIRNRCMVSAQMAIIQIIMQHVIRTPQCDICMAHGLLPKVIDTMQAVLVISGPYARGNLGDEAAAKVVL